MIDRSQILYFASHQFKHSCLISLCHSCQSISPTQRSNTHLSVDPTIQEAITVNPTQVQRWYCLPAICQALEIQSKKIIWHGWILCFQLNLKWTKPNLLAPIYFCPNNFLNFHLVYYFNFNTTHIMTRNFLVNWLILLGLCNS